jgi:membrane protein DedA with SNARE-associated domain
MELTPHILELAKTAVLHPSIGGFLWLLSVSFVGEVIVQLPLSLLFASQLLLSDAPLTLLAGLKLLALVAFPVALGSTVGSLLAYGISYFGGKPAIEKLKKFLRFSWSDVERFESRFAGNWYDELFFLVLRSAPLTPTLPVSIAAGVLRMKPFRYVVLTLFGTTVRTMLVLLVFGLGGGAVLIRVLGL